MRRIVLSFESRRRLFGGARGGGDNHAASVVLSAFQVSFCRIHERPFLEVPPNVSQSEAHDMARDALLQLNMMVRRGIEPDALMYTSLIATMGRAKLEWQAYKLFSRMLEHNVRPLPETYVALHDATAPSRRRLRQDLQLKIEESLEVFPSELAEAEMARQREHDRLCVQKFEEYMRGVLPSTVEAVAVPTHNLGVVQQESSTAAGASENAEETDSGGKCVEGDPIATMYIRNPTDAWCTARMMEERRARESQIAQGGAAVPLTEQLDRLHEEELRIFLAAQRQLRHGTKAMLIQRIMKTVTEKSIQDMLSRRKHYFRSVAQILENDLNVLHQDGNGDSNNDAEDTRTLVPNADLTLTEAEKETVAPEVLHTPWGILRKPMKRQPDPPTPRTMERLQRVGLSVDELQLVRSKGTTGDLDELPESLLRRYAYEFNLKWKRKHSLSLLEAVQWHCTTFLPEKLDGKVVVQPTPALRRQQEDEGVNKTLENYEAFRIISQRTNNLQVVDHKEINLHLKREQREALRRERRTEETLRRERNLFDAETLVSSATSISLPDETPPTPSNVLGIVGSEEARVEEEEGGGSGGGRGRIPSTESFTETSPEALKDECGELPPWAVFSSEEEFDISTGHFGDPDIGRYQELSDGRFRLLPSREAQHKWAVDRQLLPGALQEKLQRAELQHESRIEVIEKRYKEKLQYKKYRKWDMLLRKAQEKRKRTKCAAGGDDDIESEEKVVHPLPPKRRLSQLLRKGRDKAPIEETVKAKYCRSL